MPARPRGALDPPHDAPAAGRGGRGGALVHGLGRRGRAARTRSSSRCPARRRAGFAGHGGGARPAREAVGPLSRRRRARRCGISRARGCTAPRSRAPSSRARCRTRSSPGGSRPAARAPRSPAGAGWSATTGAPSTPSGGSGCTRVGFEEAPEAWLDVAIGRVRVGRMLTPWVAQRRAGARRAALPARRAAPRASVDARAGFCSARLGGSGVTVAISARAPEGQTVAFQYSDPGGGRAPRAQLLDRGAAPAGRATGAAGARARDRLWWAPTSWACGRPTTAFPWSRSPTPDVYPGIYGGGIGRVAGTLALFARLCGAKGAGDRRNRSPLAALPSRSSPGP